MAGKHRMRAQRVNGTWTLLGPAPVPWYVRLRELVVDLGAITSAAGATLLSLALAVVIVAVMA